MKPRPISFVLRVVAAVGLFSLLMLAPLASGDTLKTADSFAVLAGSTVTNAGAAVLGETVITGDLGVSPGSTCTGFLTCPTTGPGKIIGTVHLADSVALQAQKDLTNAWTNLGGGSSTGTPEPSDMVGLTLGPGVYNVVAETLTGTLKLNDGGIAGSQFVFILGALTTGTGSVIDVSGLSPTDSLFWVIGSSATLGVNSAFEGNILALSSITFDVGATDGCGRALARNAEVSFAGESPSPDLIENQVSVGCVGTTGFGGGGFNGSSAATATPEPATLLLLGSGLMGFGFLRRRRKTSN
jgi:type VI secretion system secreted protein VgrG